MISRNQIFFEEISKIKFKKPTTFINKGKGLEGISKDVLVNIRNLNGIGQNEEIFIAFYHYVFKPETFWAAERSIYNCVIFLEDKICVRYVEETKGWDRSEDVIVDYYWDNIEEAESITTSTKDDDGNKIKVHSIRLFSNCGTEMVNIPLQYFGGFSEENDSLFIKNLLNDILTKIKTISAEANKNFEGVTEEIRDKFHNEEFQTVLQIAKENFNLDEVVQTDSFLYYFLLFHIASSLKGLNRKKEALKILDERTLLGEESDVFKEWGPWIINLKAELNEDLGNYYASLQDYYTSFNRAKNVERKSLLKEKLNFTYSKYKETFSSLNYNERKMILICDEIKAAPSSTFVILDKNNLPDNLKFPFSHPKKEELYIGHPYLNDVYLPFVTYETSLFNDRFEEFSYFIQCLGAKSMTITVKKENEKIITDQKTSSTNGSVGLGKSVIKNTLGGSCDDELNSQKQDDLITSRTRKQIYSPIKKPYIPTNLLWYPHETSWFRLYQQRINGNILQHHDFMSSKSSHSISKNEKSDLKVALKTFFAEINVNRDAFVETSLNETETIEWEISVEFESIDNLKEIHVESSQNSYPALAPNNQQQYAEEIQFMLDDDGTIDEKERRILNRLSEKLGISKEQALKIESEIIAGGELNENEKEYIEEFQEFLNDGEITDKERRILNRFASRLEISSERITQLEMSVNQ